MEKSYTLNEYYQLPKTTSTRVEVYSSDEIAANLLSFHKEDDYIEVPLCDCVGDNLPMPNDIMRELDKKINSSAHRVVITGIDGYLSLLSEDNINAFMCSMLGRINQSKLNAVYMVGNTYFKNDVFSNPKYMDSFDVVKLGNEEAIEEIIRVDVAPKDWIPENKYLKSWKGLLKTMGMFSPISGDYILALSNFTYKQIGLSNRINQFLSISEIAKRFYNLDTDFSDDVLKEIIVNIRTTGYKPLDYLKNKFGKGNLNLRSALKKLYDLRNCTIWTAYVWMLQNTISRYSYLYQVLDANPTAETLLSKYSVDCTVKYLTDNRAKKFAHERAEALKEIGSTVEAQIICFISCVKDKPDIDVSPWLNCGTKSECREIIRRVSNSDLTIGLPEIWKKTYPALEDYLSEYDYGSNVLNEYFREYRRLKISNNVTSEFVKKAFDVEVPHDVPTRDSVLHKYANRTDTALMLVDGMGAEYFPLVVEIAKQNGLNIEYSIITQANLPTSTDYNNIEWDKDRQLKASHNADNVSHNGAIAHEDNTFEGDIAETLNGFYEVFNRIISGFDKYDYVVLTADHGCSRLASIAHEKCLIKDIKWETTPDDWRYTEAPKGKNVTQDFEFAYSLKKDKKFWVVRGYNRLSKPGGKLSVHGGASLEERLVPFIVFSKAKIETEKIENTNLEQIVEKDIFGDI